MYMGGDILRSQSLYGPRMSSCCGRDLVTLKRAPVNRLAATHRLLPSLCTRQSSWEVEDIGGARKADGEGVHGGEHRSWD